MNTRKQPDYRAGIMAWPGRIYLSPEIQFIEIQQDGI